MKKDIPHKWSQNRVGIAKNEFGPLPYTALKKKFKMEDRPKYKTHNYKNCERKHKGNVLWHLIWHFFSYDTKTIGNKEKVK